MSLVNSLINQIGREMGRDIYWTARQSLTNSNRVAGSRRTDNIRKRSISNSDVMIELDANDVLVKEIAEAKLGSIANATLRRHEIEKILEKIDSRINPKSFNWREAYVSMDNILDELKFKVDKNELAEIEKLDRRNLVMFNISNNQHLNWIDSQIQTLKQSPYYGLSPLSSINLIGWSVIGLASIPLKRNGLNRAAEFIAAVFWLSAAYFVLNAEKFEGLDRPVVLGVGFFALILFLLILSGNFIVRSERDAMVTYINDRLRTLEQYASELRKQSISL
jgi:hypothetical protein